MKDVNENNSSKVEIANRQSQLPIIGKHKIDTRLVGFMKIIK